MLRFCKYKEKTILIDSTTIIYNVHIMKSIVILLQPRLINGDHSDHSDHNITMQCIH